MNRSLILVFVLALTIPACKKDKSPSIMPVAGFTVDGDTSQSLTIGTYDQYSLINTSSNAESFTWDLGNGTTSKEKEIVLYYPKSGTYTVTLTSIDRKGNESVAHKTIKVVDPLLKEVVIKTLNWNSGWGRPKTWPKFSKANVWVEIVKAESHQDYPISSDGTFAAPVIYKSTVALNIDSSAAPLMFDVPQKIVIDIPTLTLRYGYQGRGYGFNLYAQDATGTYLLSSNFWSGVGALYRGSIKNDKFTISTGLLGSSVDFNGSYE
jgi:hypothetical protein